MITTWWWVRHGPTHEKSFVGWRDVPADLSDQARLARLNDHLPTNAIVVASDLSRASATADTLSPGRHRSVDDPALREFHFGDWDGLHFDAVAERDPEISRAFWETPGDVAPPGGESWNETAARVAPVVDRLNREYAGRHIIAVAHIGVIMTQIQRASGGTPTQAIAHQIDNLSVTKLVHGPEGWRTDYINHNP